MAKEYIKGFRYGQRRYESYLDSDIVKKNQTPLARVARKFLSSLPEEFKKSIPELMLELHPDWVHPHHLKPLYDAFDKIQHGERVRILLSVPPRHSKTESILIGLIRFLLTHKDKEVMYLSYAIDFAEQKSKLARNYAIQLGAKIRRDTNALSAWTIENMNSTFRSSGLVGGQISGLGADILVVDDPHKGRAEAEQTILRDKIYDTFVTDALGRLSPNASVICVHCIAKGEPVLLADGSWKSVESIEAGDIVASLEDEQFVGRKVLKTSSSGQDQTYRVKTGRHSVRANSKHPILTEGGWKKISELSTNDKIRVVTVEKFEKIESIEAAGIEEVFDLTVEGSENFIVDGVVVHNTRFHPDDLIGRILAHSDLGFTYINLPAINFDGTPLWPERWPIAELELKRKANEYAWASLYMGQPRPRGSSLFNELPPSNYYDELPRYLNYGIGYDLAYTAKTYADFSVAIVMATDGNNFYVVDVISMQADATTFSRELRKLRDKYPKQTFLSYISGPEKGSVSLLNSTGLNLSFLPARTDKFDRAQSVSAAWNAGKIFLPKNTPHWYERFITEIGHFTGVNDPHDDQVDALAGAFAALNIRRSRRDLTSLPPA